MDPKVRKVPKKIELVNRRQKLKLAWPKLKQSEQQNHEQ